MKKITNYAVKIEKADPSQPGAAITDFKAEVA
jgi:hypothetical protein